MLYYSIITIVTITLCISRLMLYPPTCNPTTCDPQVPPLDVLLVGLKIHVKSPIKWGCSSRTNFQNVSRLVRSWWVTGLYLDMRDWW